MTGGMNGVGVMVAVSVIEGVSVMVGTSVIVGDRVIVGTSVMVGVSVMVGEGGKYRKATGSPKTESQAPQDKTRMPTSRVIQPLL